MSTGNSAGRPGAGRPRDPHIDATVRAATLDLLARVGYANLTIGAVARAAGVTRPALYRRWPSKRHLVIATIMATIGLEPTPNTGDLRNDLLSGINTIKTALAGTPFGQALPALIADLSHAEDLREPFLRDIFAARRATTAAALAAAIECGAVRADIDMEFVLDALAAPLYYRAFFGHGPIDDTLVEQTVDMVLAAITTG